MEENTNQSQDSNEPTSAPVMDVQSEQGNTAANTQPETEFTSVETTPVTETGAPDTIKRPELPATHKHGAPIVPIILAIVIAAILAVVTVLAFKSVDPVTPERATQSDDTSQSEAAVTPQSVDQTSAEVDEALNATDEAADFPDAELSDQSLGL